MYNRVLREVFDIPAECGSALLRILAFGSTFSDIADQHGTDRFNRLLSRTRMRAWIRSAALSSFPRNFSDDEGREKVRFMPGSPPSGTVSLTFTPVGNVTASLSPGRTPSGIAISKFSTSGTPFTYLSKENSPCDCATGARPCSGFRED